MVTYGQFAWYEPLQMTVMMKMDEVVVENEDCWLVEMTVVDGCKWNG